MCNVAVTIYMVATGWEATHHSLKKSKNTISETRFVRADTHFLTSTGTMCHQKVKEGSQGRGYSEERMAACSNITHSCGFDQEVVGCES